MPLRLKERIERINTNPRLRGDLNTNKREIGVKSGVSLTGGNLPLDTLMVVWSKVAQLEAALTVGRRLYVEAESILHWWWFFFFVDAA